MSAWQFLHYRELCARSSCLQRVLDIGEELSCQCEKTIRMTCTPMLTPFTFVSLFPSGDRLLCGCLLSLLHLLLSRSGPHCTCNEPFCCTILVHVLTNNFPRFGVFARWRYILFTLHRAWFHVPSAISSQNIVWSLQTLWCSVMSHWLHKNLYPFLSGGQHAGGDMVENGKKDPISPKKWKGNSIESMKNAYTS